MKKLLAMLLAALLLGAGALCGCKTVTEWEVNTAEILCGCKTVTEWEVNTAEIEGGPLYTLQEIYEARAIRYRDFLNIAYHNGDQERNKRALRNFEPEPIGELSEEISLKIRESMAERYRDNGTFPEATAENIFIKNYLGCYNGYYAVRFTNNLSAAPDWETDPEDYVQEVSGIKFCYYKTSMIFLWKEN